MGDSRQDGRRFPRIPAEHTVLIESVDHSTAGFARTNVVSVGGCGFLTRESIEVGAVLEMLLTLEGRIVRAKARAVYSRPFEDGRAEVGVEFLEIADQDLRLIEQVLAVED